MLTGRSCTSPTTITETTIAAGRGSRQSVHRMNGPVAIVLDCRHASKLAQFWQAALSWRVRPYDEAEIARLAA